MSTPESDESEMAEFVIVIAPMVGTTGFQAFFRPESAQYFDPLAPLCLVGYAVTALLAVIVYGPEVVERLRR